MAENFPRFVRRAQQEFKDLDHPSVAQAGMEEDLRPSNIANLQQAIADRRHQSPMQQQVLGDELKRIKLLQTQQLMRAAQAMPQQMQQSLSPAKTGEPWPSPEAIMVRLMAQMQRRYPGMKRGPSPQVPY